MSPKEIQRSVVAGAVAFSTRSARGDFARGVSRCEAKCLGAPIHAASHQDCICLRHPDAVAGLLESSLTDKGTAVPLLFYSYAERRKDGY